MNTAPTLRHRWKMYRRGLRLAARLERCGVLGWPLSLDAQTVRRQAMNWAAPFRSRLS